MSSEPTARQEVLAELTLRDLEVLRLMAAGLQTDAIAKHLGIAQQTVERNVRHLIERLQVDVTLRAVFAAVRPGLIEL